MTMPERTRCRVEGCNRLARAKGWCAKHSWEANQGLLASGEQGPGAGRQCSIEGCENERHSKGMCPMHYQRVLRGADNWNDPRPRESTAGLPCAVDGCERRSDYKGLCRRHYGRKRLGDPAWDDPQPHKTGRKARPTQPCSVDDCGRQATGQGLCRTHLKRKTENDPNWDDPIPRPRPPKPKKPSRPGAVPADVAAALAADYAIAKRVNGTTPPDSPAHEVNRRFSAAVAALAAAGHTHPQIAEAAGGSVHMISKRITKMNASATCQVEGCERPLTSRGLCQLHYTRKRRGVPDWDALEPQPRRGTRTDLKP